MTKLVQVDAPGDLPAGYVFDATVDGKTVRRCLCSNRAVICLRIFRFVSFHQIMNDFLSHSSYNTPFLSQFAALILSSFP